MHVGAGKTVRGMGLEMTSARCAAESVIAATVESAAVKASSMEAAATKCTGMKATAGVKAATAGAKTTSAAMKAAATTVEATTAATVETAAATTSAVEAAATTSAAAAGCLCQIRGREPQGCAGQDCGKRGWNLKSAGCSQHVFLHLVYAAVGRGGRPVTDR
jgi:hypothetical protein